MTYNQARQAAWDRAQQYPYGTLERFDAMQEYRQLRGTTEDES